MHKIDQARIVTNQPEIPPQGTPGYFQETDSLGKTFVTPSWINTVQDEISNAIIGLGGTLDKSNQSQLIDLINAGTQRLYFRHFTNFTGEYMGSPRSNPSQLFPGALEHTWTAPEVGGTGQAINDMSWEKASFVGPDLNPSAIRMMYFSFFSQITGYGSYGRLKYYFPGTSVGSDLPIQIHSRNGLSDTGIPGTIYNNVIAIPVTTDQTYIQMEFTVRSQSIVPHPSIRWIGALTQEAA